MNVKIKSAIILIITMAIGVGLGIQIDRMIIKEKIKERFHRPPDSHLFMRIFERIIEPEESQREPIRRIIEDHAKRLAEIDSTSRSQFARAIDALRKDLEPILTEEQLNRIKEHTERIERFRKGGGPMRRPGKGPFRPRNGNRPDIPPPPAPDRSPIDGDRPF